MVEPVGWVMYRELVGPRIGGQITGSQVDRCGPWLIGGVAHLQRAGAIGKEVGGAAAPGAPGVGNFRRAAGESLTIRHAAEGIADEGGGVAGGQCGKGEKGRGKKKFHHAFRGYSDSAFSRKLEYRAFGNRDCGPPEPHFHGSRDAAGSGRDVKRAFYTGKTPLFRMKGIDF